MEEKLDIYKRKGSWEKELVRLKKSSLSERNKELILKFVNELFAQGYCDLRAVKLSSQLRRIAALLNKDFDNVTREDILEFMVKLNREDLCENKLKQCYSGKVFHARKKPFSYETKKDYWAITKRFFKWLKGKNTDILEDINLARKANNKSIGNLITDEDISKGLDVCTCQRDRALLMLMHETGARIGEILNMRIQDVIRVERFLKVRLDGKTGERKPLIISSVPYLLRYLETHPLRDDPNSFLWVSLHKKDKYKPLRYSGLTKVVSEAFQKANLAHVKHNPHFFRHSRASINAKFMTEVQMCLYFGWKIGSRQVATYVHASGRDVDDAVKVMYGVKEKEEREIPNKPRDCAICKTLNEAHSDYCKNCGHPLTLKVALDGEIKAKDELNKTFQLLMEIAKDPVRMAEFERFKVQNLSG